MEYFLFGGWGMIKLIFLGIKRVMLLLVTIIVPLTDEHKNDFENRIKKNWESILKIQKNFGRDPGVLKREDQARERTKKKMEAFDSQQKEWTRKRKERKNSIEGLQDQLKNMERRLSKKRRK